MSETSHDPMRAMHNAPVRRTRFVAALTSVSTDAAGRFVAGQVRYLHVARPDSGGCVVGTLLDNTQFSASALAADLLSPFVHLWVAWDPAIVLQAVETAVDDLVEYRPALEARAFGVAPWFRELVGSDRTPVTLKEIAECQGHESAQIALSDWVEASRAWAALDPWGATVPMRDEVAVLADLIHVTCMGPSARINLNRLSHGEPWRARVQGAAFRYHVPADWWPLLMDKIKGSER